MTNTAADLLSDITVEADSAGYSNYTYTQDGWYQIDVAPGAYTLWFGDETGTYANGYYSTGGNSVCSFPAARIWHLHRRLGHGRR